MLRCTSILLIILLVILYYKCVDYVKEMLVYELSDDINHIKMHREFAEIIVRKNEKSFFHDHFSNMDISLNIPYRAMKF